jgi:two-component system chemotaxis sensor kinase CheA
MSIEDTELLKEFAVESQEHLADIENQLLTLESQGDNMDVALVNTVFRAIHSIKGAAGFMGLDTLGGLAHRAEEVLNKLRNKDLRPTSVVINTLLKAADRLKELIDEIESSNDADVSSHLVALEQILNGGTLESTAETVAKVSEPTPPVASEAPAASASMVPAGAVAEAIREFLVESFDNLEQIERDLLILERQPDSEPVLNSVFRNMHTVKGSAGFLGYSKLEKLTHTAENLLGAVRSGRFPFDSSISEVLLKSIDAVRKILHSIEQYGNEGNDDFSALVELLAQIQSDKTSSKASPTSPAKKTQAAPSAAPIKTEAPSASETPANQLQHPLQ